MVEGKLDLISQELEQVKRKVPNLEDVTLVTAHPSQIRAQIRKTDHKQLTVCMQFSKNYPHSCMVMELKSKTLSEKLLDGLVKVCDAEAQKWLGQKQVLLMINFIKTFIEENPLCVCSEEIATIKKDYILESDELKLKQKTSQIVLKIQQDQYFMHIRITVPENYPLEQLQIEIRDHNFPNILKTFFLGQAVEISRRCVQPPLNKRQKDPPFKPKPALLPVCEFLVKQSIKKYPQEKCPLCNGNILPEDPKSLETDPEKNVERIYCGHLFHRGCLNTYMKTPPFKGGKKCPSCGKQIFHEKWKDSPELAETRWAHQQARLRELDEVVDFLE